MVRLRPLWLLIPLAVAALLVGCGSSSKSSSNASSSTATTRVPTGSTSSTGAAKPPAGGSAIASCKQGVQKLPSLKAATREKLEKICERAESDPEAMRKAAEEGCRELVNASPLPAGSAKDRALAACKHAGGSKSSGK